MHEMKCCFALHWCWCWEKEILITHFVYMINIMMLSSATLVSFQ